MTGHIFHEKVKLVTYMLKIMSGLCLCKEVSQPSTEIFNKIYKYTLYIEY